MARRRLAMVLVLPFLLCALAIGVAFAQVVGRGGGAAPPATGPNPNVAPMTTGTAAISGVVIDDATRLPVGGAVVYLGPPNRGPQGEPIRQITDAKGRFVFTQLPAFEGYFLQAVKFGYLEGHYGRGGSGALGARVRVVDGQWLRDLEIPLRRYGSISGVVLDEHGDPIVNAYVRVLLTVPVTGSAQLASGPLTQTDDRGQYRIGGLLPGKYILQMPTVQTNVLTSPDTRALPGGTPASAPAPGTPEPATPSAPPNPLVDVDGERQIVAGRYPTPPRGPDGRPLIYPITFYPAATTFAAAVPITLGAGEDRRGIDLRVTSVAGARVSGVLEGPVESYAGLSVRLIQQGMETLGNGSEVASSLAGENGSFVFFNVPPGAYVIDARRFVGEFQNTRVSGAARTLPTPPVGAGYSGGMFGVFSGVEGTRYDYRVPAGDTTYSGRQTMVVEGPDVAGLRVPMRRGVTISGRFVFDGDRGTLPPTSLLTLQPARGDASVGIVRADMDRTNPDTFAFKGLLPGEYLIQPTPAGHRLQSVICKDKDYTYTPFDTSTGADVTDCVATFTTKTITFSGIVRDERQSPGAPVDAAVIVFPVEREQWTAYTFSPIRLKSINTTPSGTYRFTSLPAGDYFVVALPGDQMSAWQDPALLERAAAQATRVTLQWGDTVTQNLVLRVAK